MDAKKADMSSGLSRRERQIMDALYRLGKASAAEIRDAISDPPSYTAVRTLLTILRDKGQIRHMQDGVRYIYEPVVPRDQMAKSVLADVIETFFEGSLERVVATVIDSQDQKLTDEQIASLQALIDSAKAEER
ncbi:MAG: BlaI/MecI/CopY family transcriptional regulator [Fimbriimonadaceae bacterium]|nr:BlaI/MecI/CopY family transcriptional regulator [Fimbriimonadaceae bacterium]